MELLQSFYSYDQAKPGDDPIEHVENVVARLKGEFTVEEVMELARENHELCKEVNRIYQECTL